VASHRLIAILREAARSFSELCGLLA